MRKISLPDIQNARLDREKPNPDGSGNHLSPTSKRFRHMLAGAQALDIFNGLTDMPVMFHELDREAPDVVIQGVQSGILSAWVTDSTNGFLSVPKSPVDVFTIRFVTRGAMLRRNRFGDHLGRVGHAMLVPFDGMRNEEATGGFQSIGGTVTRAALSRCHAVLEGSDVGPLPALEPVAELDRPAMVGLMLSFRSLLTRLQAATEGDDIFLPLLEEVVTYQLLTAWPQKPVRRRPSLPAARLVRMAAEYMDANLARKMTLAEVAGATGMSVRSLQAAFRQTLGQTPVQFIMERRLDKVRQDLHDVTVNEPIAIIAERWGFGHLGDFGRRYRLRFGETPRQTRLKVSSKGQAPVGTPLRAGGDL